MQSDYWVVANKQSKRKNERIIKMTDTELLEKKDLRDKMSDRVDVLDKVKKLFLIPELEKVTIKQVADYFSSPDRKNKDGEPDPQIIDVETIKKCYQRNKLEIDMDGTILETPKELTGHYVPTVKTQSYQEFQVADNIKIIVPNRGIRMFSKRAVLRIGMLLRDSDIAKEVRTQILNTFEHSTDKQKTEEINKEVEIIEGHIGRAYTSGTKEDLLLSCKEYFDYQDRYNAILQEKNDELATNNKALAGEVLTWTTRASVNKAVRVIAATLNQPFGYVWKYLYDELLYNYHISLSMRGKPPVLQYLHEDEWTKLIQILAAGCEKYGLSFDKIMQKARLSLPEESNS